MPLQTLDPSGSMAARAAQLFKKESKRREPNWHR
jgi:hypothetical protein